MKIKNLFILSIAAVVGLTACNNAKEDVNTSEAPLFIKIGAPSTASTETEVAAGAFTTITDINLFFLNSAGVKVGAKYVNSGSSNPSLADLQAGFTFTAVNSGATSVYVVANYGSDITSELTLAAIKAKTLPLTAGTNVQNGVDKWKTVLMANDAATPSNGVIAPGTPRVATVALSPVVSRIEIQSVVATADITSFELEGIFINNNFKSVSVAATGVTPHLYGYPAVGNPADYVTANFGGLADIAANMTKAPVSKCYAYQIAPVAQDATQATYPHIILKVKNVKIGDETVDGYVTVKKYNLVTNGFKANQVNKISNITFAPKDIRPNPEDVDTDVKVTVTVLPWSVVTITPDLN